MVAPIVSLINLAHDLSAPTRATVAIRAMRVALGQECPATIHVILPVESGILSAIEPLGRLSGPGP